MHASPSDSLSTVASIARQFKDAPADALSALRAWFASEGMAMRPPSAATAEVAAAVAHEAVVDLPATSSDREFVDRLATIWKTHPNLDCKLMGQLLQEDVLGLDAMPRDEPIDDVRKAAVRRHWLQLHNNEPVRLNPDAVADIAFELIQAGLQPTVENVRYVNGGKGSPNVVHPALRDFFRSELRQRWAAPAPMAGVPEPVMQLWTEALNAARAEAGTALSAQAQALELRIAAADGRERDLLAREQALDARELAQQQLIRTLESQAEQTRAERLAAEQLRAAAEDRARTAETARQTSDAEQTRMSAVIATLQSQIADTTAERDRLQAHMDEATNAWEIEHNRLSQALAAAQRERAETVSHLEAAIAIGDEHHAALTHARSDHAAAQQAADAVLTAVKTELATAKAACSALDQERIGLAATRDLLQATVDQIQSERDRLIRQLADQQHSFELLNGRLDALIAANPLTHRDGIQTGA